MFEVRSFSYVHQSLFIRTDFHLSFRSSAVQLHNVSLHILAISLFPMHLYFVNAELFLPMHR